MANLGNQKIKDTYQLLLQTDVAGNLQKLNGSTPNPFIVNGNLRYVDGAQNNGYVLLSDAAGNASWGQLSFSGDVYISGGTIEGTTIELKASSGGTISIPGLKWSANTDGSISPSGATTDVRVSGDTYVAGDMVVGGGDSVSFQVSGMSIMSGSTDLLDIFASSGITNQDVYWSASTGGISNSGLTGNVGIGTSTPNEKLTVVGSVSASTSVISPLISANTVQGSYNLIPFNCNAGSLTTNNWQYPGTSEHFLFPGLSSPTWGYAADGGGMVTGTSVISIIRTRQMSYISLPAGTRIVGIEGVIRSSINDIAYAGLFTYTPDYGGTDTVEATLRMVAPSSKNGQSNVANNPQRFKIYPPEIHQYVISDGEQIIPAFRRGDTSSAQTVLGNFTIVVKY